MKWEEVKEGDLLEFEGTAPKKYKINLIQTFAGCTTVMFSTNAGETYMLQVSLKENIADDIRIIKQ